MLRRLVMMMRRKASILDSGMSLENRLNLVLLRMLLTEIVWQNCSDLRGTLLLFQIQFIPGLLYFYLVDANLNELTCSTKSDGRLTSLDQYISRMKSGQKDIFYITGTSKEQLEKSPFLERLKKKNYEVNFSWEVSPLGVCVYFLCFFFLLGNSSLSHI